MRAREVIKEIGGVWHGSYGTGPCPVCQPERRRDQMALSVSERDGKLLIKCHKSGCEYRDIIGQFGISPQQIGNPDPEAQAKEKANIGFRRVKAKSVAQKIFDASKPFGHPYLVRKGFPSLSFPSLTIRDLRAITPPPKMFSELKNSCRLMVAPLRDFKGNITSAQLIDEFGNKCFISGGRVGGSAFRIGRSGQIVLCEGVATGLSIWRCSRILGAPVMVLCCMSADNVKKVGKLLPKGKFVAIGDNDPGGAGQAAAKVADNWVLPPVVGMDFNDFEIADQYSAVALLSQLLSDAGAPANRPTK